MLNKKEKDINNAYSFIYVYVMLVFFWGGDTGKINQKLMKIVNLQIGWI